MLDHLANTIPYVQWLKQANYAIVITGRPSISKYWLQDSSIASEFIWLAAVNAGLGCAFGAVFNDVDEIESKQRETYVKEALNIPDDRRVLAILGLGYAKENRIRRICPIKMRSSIIIHFVAEFKNVI